MKTAFWSAVVCALVGVTVGLQAQSGQLVAGQLQSEPQGTVDLAEVGLAGSIASLSASGDPSLTIRRCPGPR